MTKWQRRARLLVAVFAVAFAVMLVLAFKHRGPAAPPVPAGRTDPDSVVESTTGQTFRFNGAHEDVSIAYDKQDTYKDGSTRLVGVKIISTERHGSRTFTVTGKEGVVGQNESAITINGAVTLMASDGLIVRTEHATYTEADGTARAPGPVEFSRRRLSGSGVGMTYDKNQDVLVILDQAHVRIETDRNDGATDLTSPSAIVARRDKFIRFERGIKSLRAGQVVEADSGVAHLSDDEERVERVELQGNARITGSNADPGTLQSLTGHEMELKYASDGETLEHAIVVGEAVLQIAGQKGSPGRQIAATTLDIALAPDGTTPVALLGREAVQLTFPAEPGAAARTIKAASLDAHGEAKKGLTNARFTGEVDFREKGGSVDRVAKAGTMDVVLKPGMSSIAEATFARNARFASEGGFFAVAALARYVLDTGTLELSGTEPGAPRPHMTTEHIWVDSARMDVTLAGPKLMARGEVASALQPPKKDPKSKDTKMPSMLKGDKPVNIVAEELDYDGDVSRASYSGNARLWQTETTITGATIVIDNKNGDLVASGSALTSTMLVQGDKTKTPRDRVRSIGKSEDFKYEESLRRATYTGEAHLSGPQGDMISDKIELYLKPAGDEIDRAEAYGALTLREQNRKTTGARLTYTTSNDTYVITGAPVAIVDQCGGESVGQKLTFVQSTDTVNLDGGGQIRTQTKGSGKCS